MNYLKSLSLVYSDRIEKIELPWVPVPSNKIFLSRLLQNYPDGCLINCVYSELANTLYFDECTRCQLYYFDEQKIFREYFGISSRLSFNREEPYYILLPSTINISIAEFDRVEFDLDHGDYLELFSVVHKQMSTIELIHQFNYDAGNPGWTSARGAFIMSLRAEFERRGIDISAIADQSSISVNNQVILLKNKVHVINNN